MVLKSPKTPVIYKCSLIMKSLINENGPKFRQFATKGPYFNYVSTFLPIFDQLSTLVSVFTTVPDISYSTVVSILQTK